MARDEGSVSLGPLRGQNSSDNPLTLGEGWATETLNVVLDPESAIAVKRKGSTLLAGVPAGTYNLARHLPIGATEDQAELWAFAFNGATFDMHRKIGGGAFALVVGTPNITVYRALSFNGKLFFGSNTQAVATNRSYVWDGVSVRLVGLSVSVAPTAANQGAGAYPADPRYYKVDWVHVNAAGATAARSELSPASTVFTPSGGGAAARVTRPAVLEHATHWRVWASTDNVIYRKISGNILVATATYDDSVVPANYVGDFPELVGTFLPWPTITRLKTDGNRVLLAGRGNPNALSPGTGETAARTNRVWYTPVLGSLDQGDDERIPNTTDQKNFLDIGDPPTGDVLEIDGPLEGQFGVFTKRQPWRLVPTGNVVKPYISLPVTFGYGAGASQLTVRPFTAVGETDSGAPVIYFLDEVAGLYRLTSGARVQYVSYDLQEEWKSLRSRNPILFMGAYPNSKQTWVGMRLINPDEQRIYVFSWRDGQLDGERVRGGWVTWVIAGGGAVAMDTLVLHNRVPGSAGADDLVLVPYVPEIQTARVSVFERATGLDGVTPYAASVTAAPVLPLKGRVKFRTAPPTLIARSLANASVRVTAIRDFGVEERKSDVSISPRAAETRVTRTVEGLFSADVTALQIKVGDAVPSADLWQIDMLIVPVDKQEPR